MKIESKIRPHPEAGVKKVREDDRSSGKAAK